VKGGLPRTSKALCEQIRTIWRHRLVRYLGQLPVERMAEIKAALERHLWFDPA
jgi:mRNA interferase MazF